MPAPFSTPHLITTFVVCASSSLLGPIWHTLSTEWPGPGHKDSGLPTNQQGMDSQAQAPVALISSQISHWTAL